MADPKYARFGNSFAKKHGMRFSPEWRSWRSMRDRCLNPNSPAYNNYGGRGITICVEWDSFENFYTDLGPRPSLEHSLDRIDSDGPYTPDNCRWATPTEQTRGRRWSKKVTYRGVEQPLIEACKATGVLYRSILSRAYTKKCTVQEAFDHFVNTRKM